MTTRKLFLMATLMAPILGGALFIYGIHVLFELEFSTTNPLTILMFSGYSIVWIPIYLGMILFGWMENGDSEK